MARSSNQPQPKLLSVGIITYNDAPGLERCINSLYKEVDTIFVVDGRYPEWGKGKNLPKFSDDGTEDLCKKYTNVQYHQLYADQKTKRSKYLDLAINHHFLLVIDCDEFIINEGKHGSTWDIFKDTLRTSPVFKQAVRDSNRYVHNIGCLLQPGVFTCYGKLIYRPYELYYDNHWVLKLKVNGREIKYPNVGDFTKSVRGLAFTTDELLRDAHRLRHDTDYQWWLFRKEGYIDDAVYNDPREKKTFIEKNIQEMNYFRNTKNRYI